MIHAIRRRYRLHRLTRQACRDLDRSVRAARPTDSGSPVAAALSAHPTIWAPWVIGQHADGTPAYLHPGAVAGPGRLIRQRSHR
jgi:hypothetical protein